MKKKIITSLAAVLVVGLVSVGGTMAYLQAATAAKNNTFAIGAVDIDIKENFKAGDSSGDSSWKKEVAVKNPKGDDAIDAYVRLVLVPTFRNHAGIASPLIAGDLEPTGDTLVLTAPGGYGEITLHFKSDWSDDWIYYDGAFYYTRILEPNQETPDLLKKVTFDLPEAANYFELEVLAEGIMTFLGETEWDLTLDADGGITAVG